MEEKEELTKKERLFCEFYIEKFNGADSARRAGYSAKSAKEIASENLTKPHIQAYIKEIQKDLSKIAGISRLRVLREWENIAFSSIAHMHNSWVDRKEFEELTAEQKACISEIKTKPTMFGEEILIKLYSKEKALENITKMLGFNEAEKHEITERFTIIKSDTKKEEL